jgi:hypothetical protein
MPKLDPEQMKKKQKAEKHVCIRIFEDDVVHITDQDGNALKPDKDQKPPVGPINTYAQALWHNASPT